MKLISTTVLLAMELGLIEEKEIRYQGPKTELKKNITAVTTETEIMTITMMTITIIEGIEDEEASLATYSTLTSL